MPLRFGKKVQALSRKSQLTSGSPAALERIVVVAGVLQSPSGRVLIAQRPQGGHLAGWWEFPGGKVSGGETPESALRRELAEELGIVAGRMSPLVSFEHAYPERIVELHAWRVHDYRGDATGAEGQPIRWVNEEALEQAGLLPADTPIVAALRRQQIVS